LDICKFDLKKISKWRMYKHQENQRPCLAVIQYAEIAGERGSRFAF
jgi:hypothetical protein